MAIVKPSPEEQILMLKEMRGKLRLRTNRRLACSKLHWCQTAQQAMWMVAIVLLLQNFRNNLRLISILEDFTVKAFIM